MKRGYRCGAFTLIELIVVVAIIIVLSGMSLATYFQFDKRQSALNDARNFATELRRVRSLAKNLVYPDGCTGLIGYRLYTSCDVYDTDCYAINISASCSSGGEITISSDKRVFENAYFTEAVDSLFKAGSGYVEPHGVFPISSTNDEYTIDVETDENGYISSSAYEN